MLLGPSGAQSPVTPGTNKLGRGILGLDDPKLSRLHSHIECSSDDDAGRLEVVPQGKNQCRLYRSGHESAQVICAGERGRTIFQISQAQAMVDARPKM